MTGRHAFPSDHFDVRGSNDWATLEAYGERRERLGLPRPAHGKPWPTGKAPELVPLFDRRIIFEPELKLATDRVRAMFDEQRAEAIIEGAANISRASAESLVDAINRLADNAARLDRERATLDRLGERAARDDHRDRLGPPVVPFEDPRFDEFYPRHPDDPATPQWPTNGKV